MGPTELGPRGEGGLVIRVAFLGPLAGSFADRVRAHLTVPADVAILDYAEAVSGLRGLDVLVPVDPASPLSPPLAASWHTLEA